VHKAYLKIKLKRHYPKNNPKTRPSKDFSGLDWDRIEAYTLHCFFLREPLCQVGSITLFANKMKPFVILVALGALLAGCVAQPNPQPPNRPPQREDRILLLDNSGGYSHAGRRIELLENGNLIETDYTDVIGSARERKGSYILKGDELYIQLGDRGDQRLIRVSYGDEIYWVYPNEVEKIALAQNTRLRQTSLKQR